MQNELLAKTKKDDAKPKSHTGNHQQQPPPTTRQLIHSLASYGGSDRL